MTFSKKNIKTIMLALDTMGFLATLGVLITAFAIQIALHDTPCPLCLLQRGGLLLAAIGLFWNLRYGFKPSHYACSMLGFLFLAAVALRQIALNIMPDNPGYGISILGLHMYTWSLIFALIMMIYTAILSSVDKQYLPLRTSPNTQRLYLFQLVSCITLGLLAAGNIVFLIWKI